MIDDTTQVYEVFIKTTPEALWRALIDPEMTKKYFFGTLVRTTAKPGEAIVFELPSGGTGIEGQVIEAQPPYKLVHTWIVKYDEELAKERSTVTWTIEKRGTCCKLTAVHELRGAPKVAKHVGSNGWSVVLSGLKTLLETGEPLVISDSAG
jgi:uncharacterized protein YndB with AHSA1/START domain